MQTTNVTQYLNNRLGRYAEHVRDIITKSVKNIDTATLSNTVKALTDEIKQTSSMIEYTPVFEFDKIRAETYNAFVNSIQIDIQTIYEELDAMIAIYNEISNAVSVIQKETEDQINLTYTKVRSLSKIYNKEKTIDRIDYETFIDNDNQYKDTNPLVIPNKSGLLRLKTEDQYKIYAEENDGTVTVTIPNNLAILDFVSGSPSSEKTEDAVFGKFFSQTEETITIDIGGETVVYNGILFGTVINLPATRNINNISFSPLGDYELDIIGVYYNQNITSKITDLAWHKIDTMYDTANYHMYELNFDQVSAASVMILLGQSHYTTQDVIIPKKFMLTTKNILEESKSLSDRSIMLEKYRDVFEELISNNDRYISDYQLNMLISEKGLTTAVGNFSDSFKRLLIGLFDLLNHSDSEFIKLSGNVYTSGLYNIRINLNEYVADGTYISPTYTYNNTINSIQLGARSTIPEDNSGTETGTILYTIQTPDGDIPIVPASTISAFTTRDVNIVINRDIKRYELRFLANIAGGNTVVVLINGNVLDNEYYTINSISDSIATSIDIDEDYLLNINDIISVEYTISDTDKFNRPLYPYVAEVKRELPLPHIIDKDLYYCTGDCVLIQKQDVYGGYTKYNLNENIYRREYPKDSDSLETDMQWFIPTVSLIPGADGIGIPVEDYYQLQDDDYFMNASGYRFSEDNLIPSVDYAYHGIINEPCVFIAEDPEYDLVASGYRSPYTGVTPTIWETEYEYVPGSLSVKVEGTEAWCQEYPDDILGYNIVDRNYFYLLENYTAGQSIVCSYIPISASGYLSSYYSSNIKDYNAKEYYDGTSKDSTIEIQTSPFIDTNIIRNTTLTESEWAFQNGKYVLISNTDIVYIPVKIELNGYILENKTDYINGTKPQLDLYDKSINNVQFYHDKNKVYFNRVIDERIDVSYYRLLNEFALKVEMYRHTKTNSRRSPELYDYALLIDLE